MKKCSYPDGITIKPDGINELDPCIYKVKQKFTNVTIEILECQNCGHVEISWFRQPNTEEVDIDLEGI